MEYEGNITEGGIPRKKEYQGRKEGRKEGRTDEQKKTRKEGNQGRKFIKGEGY